MVFYDIWKYVKFLLFFGQIINFEILLSSLYEIRRNIIINFIYVFNM